MSSAPVSWRRDGGVAVITVDHPPVNALSRAVRAGLLEAVRAASADPQVRALLVRCAGRTFIAGADIGEFARPPEAPLLPELVQAIEDSGKPVVAALHGTALGGGFEVALAAHWRLAASGTKVGLPEVKLGIIPGAGGTQRLPRAVGKAKAMDLVLTGRLMDAAEAERAGLVSRVVPAAELLDVVLAAAQTICEFSGPSVMMAKECVNRAYEGPLAEGMLFERRMFHSLFATDDQKEGMAAFVEKRKPSFRHR